MIVYVAQVDLKYEVVAVAKTKTEAIKLASEKACEFLKLAGQLYPETETPEKIIEYFGVSVTRLKVGTADYVGN